MINHFPYNAWRYCCNICTKSCCFNYMNWMPYASNNNLCFYIIINKDFHDFFKRNNTDVICQMEISFVQAVLGDSIAVPTLNGEKMFEIPKGTQPGDLFRFRGEGIPSLRSNKRGDQIVEIMIKTPTNINKKQEVLLREFAKIESNKLPNKLKNILKNPSYCPSER